MLEVWYVHCKPIVQIFVSLPWKQPAGHVDLNFCMVFLNVYLVRILKKKVFILHYIHWSIDSILMSSEHIAVFRNIRFFGAIIIFSWTINTISTFYKCHVAKICGRHFKITRWLELHYWPTRKPSQPSQRDFFTQIAL